MAVWTVIDHQVADGGTNLPAYWEKTSIPSSYDHLLLRASVKSDGSGYVAGGMAIQLNNDNGYNYTYCSLEAGLSAGLGVGGAGSNQQYASTGALGGTSVNTSVFTFYDCWIPNYSGTTGDTQMLIRNAMENASTTADRWYLYLGAALWHSTAAVNRIKAYINAGDNFAEYSSFTLYGITGN